MLIAIAILQLAEAQKNALNARDRLLRLQIGISSPSRSHGGYIQVFPQPGPRGSIHIGLAEAAEGSTVRLHVQDPQWAQQEMKSLLQVANLISKIPTTSCIADLTTSIWNSVNLRMHENLRCLESLPFSAA